MFFIRFIEHIVSVELLEIAVIEVEVVKEVVVTEVAKNFIQVLEIYIEVNVTFIGPPQKETSEEVGMNSEEDQEMIYQGLLIIKNNRR